MVTQTVTVAVQSDFLERQATAKPQAAVAELVWNALDADATKVDVVIERDALNHMSSIIIQDNGHGMSREEAPELFGKLGGSWKRPGGKTPCGRFLHGQEGKGRYKAFALGRVAEWKVTYKKNDGLLSYLLTIIQDDLRNVQISDETPAGEDDVGVVVTVSELHKEFRSLTNEDDVLQGLTEMFALYLKDYQDVVLCFQSHRVDPIAAIASTESFDLKDIVEEDGTTWPVKLELVEWRFPARRLLYLCNEQGFPLAIYPTRFHVGDHQFSAYFKSGAITKLHREGTLDLAEMHPWVVTAAEDAHRVITKHFRHRAAEKARDLVESWKAEKVYPYEGEAVSPMEKVERQVFDIVAVQVNDSLPGFESTPPKSKAFHLRLLRQAIERSPEELQLILNNVLDLSKRKQKELAELLQETSLAAIISASKTIADRMKFLSGLEAILFDGDKKARLRERSQLHHIVADNTWIFGEEYHLAVSDRSLTEVLVKHRHLLGEDIVIDTPVKHISQSRGIVDLMLSRALRRHRANELEHLVVELKRPAVKIGDEEVTQIEKYAISVANDERFRTASNGVRWVFWVLSDEMDDYAAYRITDDRGTISDKNNITVGIKTWAQILAENKARLQFFQEKLEYEADKSEALRFLQEKYAKFLEGVIDGAGKNGTDEKEEGLRSVIGVEEVGST